MSVRDIINWIRAPSPMEQLVGAKTSHDVVDYAEATTPEQKFTDTFPEMAKAVYQGLVSDQVMKNALMFVGAHGGSLAAKALNIGTDFMMFRDATNYYRDWYNTVGRYGRTIKYPMMSAVGRIPSAAASLARNIDGLFEGNSRTRRYL